MCMIMMQMTDFTRGTGPLKSTSDVIESARNIAKLGNDLDALASQIAEVNLPLFCQLICKYQFNILGMSRRLGPK